MATATPEKPGLPDSKDNHVPHRYIWGFLTLFLIMVAGIMVLDFLRYCSSQQSSKDNYSVKGQRSEIEIVIKNDVGGIWTTNIVLPIGTGTNLTTFSYVTNSPRLNIRILSSQTATQSALNIVFTNVPQMMPGATAMQPMLASASFFEAYARLITLVLSILSVLGLFFAYFVRKSLREIEEDVEKRFDRTLKSWETDQKAIRDQNATYASEIKAKFDEIVKLHADIKQLKVDLTDAINELGPGRATLGVFKIIIRSKCR